MSSKTRKQNEFSWWLKRIDVLKGSDNEASKLYQMTKIAYPPGRWALLKLSILSYYVDIYTNIIKHIFPQTYYLDLFAGPGLDIIRETGDVIFGSPLIADRIPRSGKKFDKLILIESNADYAKALQELLPNSIVINRDVNESGLDEALAQFQRTNVPFLAFVDPEGLEIKWTTMTKILERWSDVIINFQSSAAWRTAGLEKQSVALTEFFGTDQWTNCQTPDDYLNLYLSQLKKYKEYAIPVKVHLREAGGFYYYIVIAVGKTKGTQNWIKAIYSAKEKIEKAHNLDAISLLEIHKGKQKTLINHL